jgi:MFS family permease
MVGLCAAVFLAALNQTVVGTAIPTISTDLRSASGYAWIGAAYLLANAVAAPIWSKLSDIWGRKVILLTAVALYFAFSTICAVSRTMEMLIIGRSLQGAAGGGLIQIVYAIISDMFSMRTRTFYLGLLQMMWATAGGLGPLIGGIFANTLHGVGSFGLICLSLSSYFASYGYLSTSIIQRLRFYPVYRQ